MDEREDNQERFEAESPAGHSAEQAQVVQGAGPEDDLGDPVDRLSPEEKALWQLALKTWSEPEEHLRAIREALEKGEPPSLHIRSAEGIALFQGLAGRNGKVSLLELVDGVIAAEIDATRRTNGRPPENAPKETRPS